MGNSSHTGPKNFWPIGVVIYLSLIAYDSLLHQDNATSLVYKTAYIVHVAA